MPTPRPSLVRRLLGLLTVTEWLPSYTREDLRGDVAAGVTVGVMLIPQGMAYALLAGVPPVYGLYASIVPLMVYPLLGTSRHLAVGIAALDMLIVAGVLGRMAPATDADAIHIVLTLTALVGLLHMAMGALRLGFLVDLLSKPVITGFVTAAPLLIGLSQVGNLLGIPFPRSQHLVDLIAATVAGLPGTHVLSAAVGLGGVALLAAWRRWRLPLPGSLVLVVAATLASGLAALAARGVAVVGEVPRGLPHLGLPLLAPSEVVELLPAALTLALVQVMSVMSLAKALAAQGRYRIAPNRELVALGASNLAGSLFSAVPVSGSFSRTAVNADAGARTALANAFAGLVVLGAILVAGPVLALVPKPALAAIVIVSVIGMIDVRELLALYRLRRGEGAVALLTFGATLAVGIEPGVLSGIIASMLVLLYRVSRPHVAELGELPDGTFRDVERIRAARRLDGLLILRVDGPLTFASAEFVREDVLARLDDAPEGLRAVCLDGRGINDIDTTGLDALEALVDTLESRGLEIYLSSFKARLRDLLERTSLPPRLARCDIARGPEEAAARFRERATLPPAP